MINDVAHSVSENAALCETLMGSDDDAGRGKIIRGKAFLGEEKKHVL